MEDLGSGWKWNIEKDQYQFLNEYWITGDIVRERMKNWGRKIEKVHTIEVLNSFYRMANGLE